MVDIFRRKTLKALVGTGVAALWPATLSAQPALPVPPSSMRLSRRIERELRDKQVLIVERDWKIAFMRQGRGISISGSQLSARVTAPQRLSSIAAIEKQRSTEAMWPILLSQEGLILAAGEYTQPADMKAAVRQAEAMMAAKDKSTAAAKQRESHLKQLQRAANSLFDQMAPDLFYPEETAKSLSEYVELPEGLIGKFSMAIAAERAADGPWMARSQRVITTEIGEEKRESSETWKMEPFEVGI